MQLENNIVHGADIQGRQNYKKTLRVFFTKPWNNERTPVKNEAPSRLQIIYCKHYNVEMRLIAGNKPLSPFAIKLNIF